MNEFERKNPYQFAPTIDEDLFHQPEPDPDAVLHTFDGNACVKCGRAHDLYIPNTVLPIDTATALSKFLDTVPDQLLDFAVVSGRFSAASLINGFKDFSATLSSSGNQAALVLALASVVDEAHNGEVSRRFQVYLAEQMIVNGHVLTRILNNYYTHLKTEEAAGKLRIPPDIRRGLDEVDRICAMAMDDAITLYRQRCEEQHYPVDEHIIATGTPGPDRPFARDMLVGMVEAELLRQAEIHERIELSIHHHFRQG